MLEFSSHWTRNSKKYFGYSRRHRRFIFFLCRRWKL